VSIVDEPEQGFSLGASDYLLKPFDREDLLNRLRCCTFAATNLSAPVRIWSLMMIPWRWRRGQGC
jgi:hypothetical protein